MKYRTAGRTGLRVSEIGFGTGTNAGLMAKADLDTQVRVVERALELGINYFDTSPAYGQTSAEVNLGKVMRILGFRPIITTKVEVMPNHLNRIADAVTESVENSLRRLGVDFVDIVQIHNPPSLETNTDVPGWIHLGINSFLGPGGALEGLDRLRRAGKVRFFGTADEDADPKAVSLLIETGEFHLINVWYDLLNPTAGMARPDGLRVQHDYGQFMNLAHQLGTGVAVMRPLAGGVLTDNAIRGEGRHPLAGGALSRTPQRYEAMLDRARAFSFLANERHKLSEVAYRFILMNPHVTTVIGGFSEVAHVEEAVCCSSAPPLDEEEMARIAMVWRSNFGLWDMEETRFIGGV